MTKRVILSVILLVLALSLSVTSYCLLQKRFASLGDALKDAVYADVSPSESAEAIDLQWQKSTKLFHIFLMHSDLADLQTEIESLADLVYEAFLLGGEEGRLCVLDCEFYFSRILLELRF